MPEPSPRPLPAAPLRLHEAAVQDAWLDDNGHMNVAYYVLVFDQATDAVLDHLGLGCAYRAATGRSVFVAEAHVTYEDEARGGDRVAVASRLLGFDGKRIILFHEMSRVATGMLIATNEVLCLHVDLTSRRTAPLGPAEAGRLKALAATHAALPRPAQAGRAIGLASRRPPRV